MLLLEPIHDLSKGRVVLELESIPKSPGRVSQLIKMSIICVEERRRRIYLVLGGGDGIRESEERQCQIDEPVLVFLQIIFAIDDL